MGSSAPGIFNNTIVILLFVLNTMGIFKVALLVTFLHLLSVVYLRLLHCKADGTAVEKVWVIYCRLWWLFVYRSGRFWYAFGKRFDQIPYNLHKFCQLLKYNSIDQKFLPYISSVIIVPVSRADWWVGLAKAPYISVWTSSVC